MLEVVERDGQARVESVLPAPRRRLSGEAPASIVVVGAGAAGAAAVEMLRREGYDGSITLIGDEPPGPVDRRTSRSTDPSGAAAEADLPLRPSSFYREELGVTLLEGIARDGARHGTAPGDLRGRRTLAYGALLLATGAEPIRLSIPGASLPHVHVLRSLADAQAIIARTLGARRAAVIGASFIGLEAAAALRRRGLEVEVIAAEAVPLARILGEELGQFVKGVHEAHGVRFICRPARARSPREIELESGKIIAADLVITGSACVRARGSPRRRGSPCRTAWWSTRCWSRAPPACSPRETSRAFPRRASDSSSGSSTGSWPGARARPRRAPRWATDSRSATCRSSGASTTT